MNTKPEALRLAAQLEDTESARLHLLPYAAAELRRLHEVVQHLLRERNINLESAQRDTARIAGLEKQRDELLEALHCISLASKDSGSTREGMGLYARAAIAKVKGEKQ